MRIRFRKRIPAIITVLLIGFVPAARLLAQEYYWVEFKDKKDSPYSISNPRLFLSERAIQRRLRQNILIDETDLPVNPAYLSAMTKAGVQVVHASKWLNGVTIRSNLVNFPDSIKKLNFIKEFQLTKPLRTTKSSVNKFSYKESPLPIDTSKYGASVFQTGIMNGQYLHNKGYLGKDMVIAILDAGFYKVNQYPAFSKIRSENRILGTWDFVNPASDIYAGNSHGMSVLSTIGGYIPGSLIGTAPEASFWLLRSEDSGSEYLIEEDNWVVAAEFADSAGVDIINSSLGYTQFDDPAMNHVYKDLDGKTTRITKAANIAASKGILVFASAGNERNKTWHYIVAPSDGDSVLGVAAVNKSGQAAAFSSAGPSSDGDVKPNIAAIGWGTVLQGSSGTVVSSSGTSFSSPVMAGMAACLWQANPNARARDVKAAIEQSGNLFAKPDTVLGFGIPDFKVADLILKTLSLHPLQESSGWQVFPNPFNDRLLLHFFNNQDNGKILITLTNLDGKELYSKSTAMQRNMLLGDVQFLPAGVYILKIRNGSTTESAKVIKVN